MSMDKTTLTNAAFSRNLKHQMKSFPNNLNGAKIYFEYLPLFLYEYLISERRR